MKLSQTSEMAIHGLWELAQSEDNQRVLVSEIAKRQSVSESYLAKIFHRLGKEGLVQSRRGKVGGFMLAKPAKEITLGEIVRIFESDFQESETSPKKFVNPRKMVLHGVMEDATSKAFGVLDNVSLADLQRESPSSESPTLSKRKYTRREGKA